MRYLGPTMLLLITLFLVWTYFLARRAQHRRVEAVRPRLVRIRVVRFLCRVCDEPIGDGDVAVRRLDLSGHYFSHVKCVTRDVLEKLDSAP